MLHIMNANASKSIKYVKLATSTLKKWIEAKMAEVDLNCLAKF
jgi:hypothetical protein